jgi:hypothetical protein
MYLFLKKIGSSRVDFSSPEYTFPEFHLPHIPVRMIPLKWTYSQSIQGTSWRTGNFFFKQCWGLNSGLILWTTPPVLFCEGFCFLIMSQGTICRGWLCTMILLISASWVARITGVSHRHPAQAIFLMPYFNYPFKNKITQMWMKLAPSNIVDTCVFILFLVALHSIDFYQQVQRESTSNFLSLSPFQKTSSNRLVMRKVCVTVFSIQEPIKQLNRLYSIIE